MARLDYQALNDAIRYLMFSVYRVTPGVLGDDREAAIKEAQAFFDGLGDQGAGRYGSGVVTRGIYDVAGMRADADFMIWTPRRDASRDLQAAYSDFRRSTELGRASDARMEHRRPAPTRRSLTKAMSRRSWRVRRPATTSASTRSYAPTTGTCCPTPNAERMLADHGKSARGYPDVRANTVFVVRPR